jgi:hypothetical protein
MIGGLMSHFGMTYDYVTRELPFHSLVLLSSSVPKFKPKKDKPENPQAGAHLFDLLGGDKIPTP